ncbi:MAG TPA: hypothetical protein VJB12_02700 [Candidatus Nanoarchaeia archaeon]|nr:hypothetical protein [Candidatus Nanoarchaeia archaeon]
MDWKACVESFTAKRISPEKGLISSLSLKSKNRLSTAARLLIDETTAESVITLHYDSLRELLEALANAHGYKIYNHECYGAFLKEILKKEETAEAFDRFRKLRNSINYYTRRVSPQDAKMIAKEMSDLIKTCRTWLEEALK